MSVPRRTMRDIKTLTGRVDRIANPYMAYMQITCLEMEKARKRKERESAQHRLATLDTRLREIEIEKGQLLGALAANGAHPELVAPGRGASRPTARVASARSAMRLRY